MFNFGAKPLRVAVSLLEVYKILQVLPTNGREYRGELAVYSRANHLHWRIKFDSLLEKSTVFFSYIILSNIEDEEVTYIRRENLHTVYKILFASLLDSNGAYIGDAVSEEDLEKNLKGYLHKRSHFNGEYYRGGYADFGPLLDFIAHIEEKLRLTRSPYLEDLLEKIYPKVFINLEKEFNLKELLEEIKEIEINTEKPEISSSEEIIL